jgi:hypothetical protein
MKTQRVQFEICWALAALAMVCLIAAIVRTVLDLDRPSELVLITAAVVSTSASAAWCLWVLSRAARRTFRVIRAYAPVRRR